MRDGFFFRELCMTPIPSLNSIESEVFNSHRPITSKKKISFNPFSFQENIATTFRQKRKRWRKQKHIYIYIYISPVHLIIGLEKIDWWYLSQSKWHQQDEMTLSHPGKGYFVYIPKPQSKQHLLKVYFSKKNKAVFSPAPSKVEPWTTSVSTPNHPAALNSLSFQTWLGGAFLFQPSPTARPEPASLGLAHTDAFSLSPQVSPWKLGRAPNRIPKKGSI